MASSATVKPRPPAGKMTMKEDELEPIDPLGFMQTGEQLSLLMECKQKENQIKARIPNAYWEKPWAKNKNCTYLNITWAQKWDWELAFYYYYLTTFHLL